MKKKFIILDRDGTICEDRGYLADPNGLEIIPGAVSGLLDLQKLGYGLVIVTNQSGVGRGYFTLTDMQAVNDELLRQLNEAGIRIAGIYSCPHLPSDDCSCRKPNTGLIKSAVDDLGFEPAESIVIGDKESDVKLGKAIGAVTFLVLTGHGVSERTQMTVKPTHVVADVKEAALIIAKEHT